MINATNHIDITTISARNVALWIGIMLCGIIASVWWHEWWILLTPLSLVGLIMPFRHIRAFYFLFIFLLSLSADIQIGAFALNLPSEPMMVGMLLLLMWIVIINRDYLAVIFPRNVIIHIIILQLFWLILSVTFATHHGIAIKFLLSKSWFLASFLFFPLILIRNVDDIILMAKLFFIPIFIHTFFVIAWHGLLGFGYYESNVVVFPFYKNHVDYGSMLSILFAINFTLITVYWKRPLWRWLLLCSLVYLSVALVAASSRGAMLAAFFSIVVFVGIKIRKAHWVMPSFYAFVLIVIFFFAYDNNFIHYRPDISKNASQETLLDTIIGTFTGKDMSSMERFYRWIASIRMTQDEPLVGVGPNNWYYHYKPYAVQSFRTWVSRNPEQSTTHNYFLLMMTEQGIPAMLLYATLMAVLISYGQRLYYRIVNPKSRAVLLAAILIISSIFVNNFFSEFLETHKIGGVFFLCIATIILIDRWHISATVKKEK